MAYFLLLLVFVSTDCLSLSAQNNPTPRIAVLDFAPFGAGLRASDQLAAGLASKELTVLDRDLARAAAKGSGYTGSLNLVTQQARDLGAALGCDYYILGDAQTLRRSPSTGEAFFEAYASLFLVSARTGNLVFWSRPAFKAATPAEAEQQLFAKLSKGQIQQQLLAAVERARAEEREQLTITETPPPVIEQAPDDEKVASESGLQLPRAFRRLRPTYPESAAQAEVEATVDVLADIDDKGRVTHVEIARWAGFGLDESSAATVRRLHFFPALRNGSPIPIRVLLRYNFRKPAN
jgi:TonB family protein